MKRLLHPHLQRGRLADSAAILLLVGLLAVLVASVALGVMSL